MGWPNIYNFSVYILGQFILFSLRKKHINHYRKICTFQILTKSILLISRYTLLNALSEDISWIVQKYLDYKLEHLIRTVFHVCHNEVEVSKIFIQNLRGLLTDDSSVIPSNNWIFFFHFSKVYIFKNALLNFEREISNIVNYGLKFQTFCTPFPIHASNPWPYKDHKDEYNANHKGSADKINFFFFKFWIFKRFVKKYNIKYTYYIGGGDTKLFKMLLDKKNYTVMIG